MSQGVLWCALALPSLSLVHQHGGWQGGLAYALLVWPVALWVGGPGRRPDSPPSWSSERWLAAATWVAIVVLFAVVYPVADVQVPGRGSDADDALNIGVRAMLAGHSPYATTTYLGNELSPLPGALLLALPFVLLGTSALQNLLWIPVFFLAVARATGDRARALHLAWTVLLASPVVLHEVMTGGDHSANSVYVLLGMQWLLASGGRPLAAAAWGVTLASRANFLLLVLPVCGWLWRHHGRTTAVRAAAIALGVAGLLTVPFVWHHGLADFAPLHAVDRLTRFDAVVPQAGAMVLGTMLAAAGWLAFRPVTASGLLLGCAGLQAWPVLAAWDVGLLHYGVFASWFAVMALARSGQLTAGSADVDGLEHQLDGFHEHRPL